MTSQVATLRFSLLTSSLVSAGCFTIGDKQGDEAEDTTDENTTDEDTTNLGTTGDTDSDVDTETDTNSNDPCIDLEPGPDPTSTRIAIQECLALGSAHLGAGTFIVDQGLTVPAGAILLGAGRDQTFVQLGSSATNYLISLVGGAEVGALHLDAAQKLPAAPVNAVVVVTGSGNTLHDLYVGELAGTLPGLRDQAVYFVDSTSTGNVLRDSELSGTFYGVIFVAGLPAGSGNRVENVEIHDHPCDSVTFVGYGEVVGSHIHDNGWDCENGPIPGGGLYSLGNTVGARIEDNVIHDTCGHGIDLDQAQGFEIVGNSIYDPGNTWGGARPWCGGAAAIALMDSSHNTLSNNMLENNDRPQNAGSDPNQVFHAEGAPAFSDLPMNAVIALAISQRPGSPGSAMGNQVDGNVLHAACASGCIGVGYFSSRGTGTDALGAWSAETTGYYTANNPFGSNVGSVRCGGNWYAASSDCPASPTDPACNQDDYQHTFDWSRNDDCRDF
ncbi:right-handed parallel beta-helix repeat-containing protein [Nannocystaceae bacterium ST9]